MQPLKGPLFDNRLSNLLGRLSWPPKTPYCTIAPDVFPTSNIADLSNSSISERIVLSGILSNSLLLSKPFGALFMLMYKYCMVRP